LDANNLTPAQAAQILGMKTSSIYALISRHELSSSKVGRSRFISLSQLEAYKNSRGTRDSIDYTYAT